MGRFPGEGSGNPLQYPDLENPMDRGAWQATVHGIEKGWTDLTTKTSISTEPEVCGAHILVTGWCPAILVTSVKTWAPSLEEEMATHSSILTWKIPWIEEPGRLQSMGLQRVRHD